MKNRDDVLVNHVANPVVADLDVFRAFIHQVLEIDQSDRTEVIDAKLDRLVVDQPEFHE